MVKRKTEERSSGDGDLESRLFVELGKVGISPGVIEIEEGKVRISDRTSSYRVAIANFLEGLEATLEDPGRRFLIKDQPLGGQIRHLSWLGRQILGTGRP